MVFSENYYNGAYCNSFIKTVAKWYDTKGPIVMVVTTKLVQLLSIVAVFAVKTSTNTYPLPKKEIQKESIVMVFTSKPFQILTYSKTLQMLTYCNGFV